MINKPILALILPAALAIAPQPLAAQQLDTALAGLSSTGAAAQPQVAMISGASANYQIGPSDLLLVSVYRAPDLGGQIRVASDGTVIVPGLGAVAVAGKTAADVAQTITRQIVAKGILLAPDVNVLVTEVRANTVEVMGQVARPGKVPLDQKGLTLMAVLARAGVAFGSGSGMVSVMSPDGLREHFQIADLVSGASDRAARPGEMLVVEPPALVYISGEVGHPGAFPVERAMTLGQALALGGGITPRGSRNRVRLTRTNPDKTVQIFDHAEPAMPVMPNDLIEVKQRLF